MVFLKELDCPKWKKVYVTLHGKNPRDVRETSRWKLASLQNISCEEHSGKACKDIGKFENDHPFKYEAARRAFKTFLEYTGYRSAETSLFALIQFDDVMTDAIGSFSLFFQSFQSTERSLLACDEANA